MTCDIEEADLECVIPEFYRRVRANDQIGPLFNTVIEDWPHHLDRLIAFWSSVMLTSGRYKGSPMAAHLKHRDAINPAMFECWLRLWDEVTGELLSDAAARAMQAKAQTIGESLKLALFFRLEPKGAAA